MTLKQEALDYHSSPPQGKLEIVPTKPSATQRDLSLAYSPGVAEPCLAIEKNPEDAYLYTGKGNFIAIVTNGTAVLGLGDIGALAGKPVMEGKGLLFKRFADVNAIDIEIDTHDPDLIIQTVKLLEPTFGGINLEDIKAPECFYIEETLKREMNIPVFHDDQHGTAIISGAGLLNALEVQGKRIEEARVVLNGAGAGAIACARFYLQLGFKREHILMCDSKGVIYRGRATGMNPQKEEFAADTPLRTLAEALVGADVFVGLSVKNAVTPDMAKTMAARPIIFALANPDPEIPYDVAKAARPDAIVATGRSDFPNQVNNVLGFPFIFRGALDVRARQINEEMKVAAARALASLTREGVPEAVAKAYGLQSLQFGPDYIIPKPVDPRVLLWEAPAIAQAAMDSGVARLHIDLDRYREQLEARLGKSKEMMRIVFNKAKTSPKRLVLAEGENERIIRAARQISEEKIAVPVLLGNRVNILAKAHDARVDLGNVEIVDPAKSADLDRYTQRLFELRSRKGVTRHEAGVLIHDPNYFAAVMVELGDADAMLSGLSFHYPEALRPPLQIIRTAPEWTTAAGVYLVTLRNRVLFFADTTVNINPDAETLAEIAILTAQLATHFDIEPSIALLSYSNFGSVRDPNTDKVRRAVEIVRRRAPQFDVDGEMQADTALVPELLKGTYPFSTLRQPPNVLIFPTLEAGNIGYKLVQRLGNAEVVGPILVGLNKPVYVLQRGDEVKDIVNLAAMAAVEAQESHA